MKRLFSSLFVVFNQGYYIEVISKTFSSHLTLTHFLIFLQPLKIVVLIFFFLLDQKVGLTASNHATYPKLQSNIRLKLSVLESIKKQNKYLGGLNLDILQVEGNMKKKIFFNQVFKSTLSKKYLRNGGSHTTSVRREKL